LCLYAAKWRNIVSAATGTTHQKQNKESGRQVRLRQIWTGSPLVLFAWLQRAMPNRKEGILLFFSLSSADFKEFMAPDAAPATAQH